MALLLGGKQNKLIAMLDKITSGLLLGGMFKAEDLLAWFDAKTDHDQGALFLDDNWKERARTFIESGRRPDLAKRARWMWSQLD